MEKLSALISKRVLSSEQSQIIGYVINACVDAVRNLISGLLVCDDETDAVNFLDIKNVLYVNDFVVIKNSNVLSFGEHIEDFNPIGKIVASEKGEFLGNVIDVEFHNKKITKIITNKSEINPKNIFNWDKNCLIFTEKKKIKSKLNHFPKIELKNNQKVEILENKNNNQIPFKSSLSPQKLIGRITTQDIYGFNNELIVRKDQIITDKIIKVVKKHNKINYLVFNSK